MDSLYEKKNCALSAVNELMLVITNLDSVDNGVIDELNKKNETLNQMNNKLISEISVKDKDMSIMQKTIDDYQGHLEELTSVKEEENKFGMLKAKDKEISNLNKEITSLKKELDQANYKLELINEEESNQVSCELVDDTNVDSNINEDDEKRDDEKEIDEKEIDDKKEDIDETPVDDEVSDNDSDKDIPEYVSKKIKGVKYVVEKNNPKSKIYTLLDDGDVGDIVGELDGKKKIFY